MNEIMGMVEEYDKLPKSVTFTSASLTSVTKSKVIVTLTGTLKTKAGSSKTLKYKINYDRAAVNADIFQASSD